MDELIINTKLDTKGFAAGSKKLLSAIKSFGQGADRTMNTIERTGKSLLNTIIKWGPALLGVRGAYQIISKATQSFLSENQQLAANLSSAWTALGNVLGPIITTIVNLITTAMSYFINFLKLLGLSSKSASEASKSAKGASQELKRQLMGFDELNVLNDNQGGGGGPNGQLEDKELPEWLKMLADFLKNKMWDEAADLLIAKMNELIYTFRDKAYEFGKKAGEYLQGALHIIARWLDEVDWKQLGVGLANFFNGLLAEVEGINLGEDLGKILVAKFTIAFKIISGFIETFDMERLGGIITETFKGAFKSLRKAIDEANPELIGQQIATLFNSIKYTQIGVQLYATLNKAWNFCINTLASFIEHFQPKQILDAILLFFNGISFEDIGNDIYTVLSKALDKAIELLTPKEGEDSIGKRVGTAIINAIASFFDGLLGDGNGDDLATKISTAIEQIIKNGIDLLSGVQEGAAGVQSTIATTLTTLISKLFTDIKWDEIASSVSTLIHTAVTDATALLDGLDKTTIMSSFITFLTNVVTNLDIGQIASDVADFIISFCNSAGEMLNTVKNWGTVGSQLWTWFSGEIQEVDWDSLASAIFTALGTALGAVIGIIDSFIRDAITSIFDKFRAIATGGDENAQIDWKDIALGILKGIGEGFKNIVVWIYDNILTPFVNGIKSCFGIHSPATTMIGPGHQIAKGLLEGILSVFRGIYDWIKKKIFTPFIDNLKELFGIGDGDSTSLLEIGKSIINGLLTGVENVLADLTNWLTNTIFNPIVNGIKELFGIGDEEGGVASSLLSIGTSIINGLKNGISSGIDSVVELFTGLWERVKGIWDNITGLFSSGEEAEEDPLAPKTEEYIAAKADYEAALNALKTYKDTYAGYATDDMSSALYNAEVEKLQAAVDDAKAKMESLKTTTEEVSKAGEEDMGNFVDGAEKKLEEGMPELVEEVDEKTEEMLDTVDNNFRSGSPSKETEEDAENFIEGFVSGFESTKDEAEDAVDAFTSSVLEIMDELSEKVKGTAEKLANNWQTCMNQMASVSSSGVSRIRSAMSSGLSGLASSAYNWGYDMMIQFSNGLIQGFNNYALSSIYSVTNTMRRYLHFSEPDEGPLSDFHTYMPDMMKLMAEGIDKNVNLPLNAVSGLTEGMAEQLNGLSTAAIISKLQSVADNVAYQSPAFANGNVLPYSVNAQEAQKAAADGYSFVDIVEAIDSLKSFLNVNQSRSDETPVFQLYIDGQQITNVVTKRQIRESIARGTY